MLENQKIRRQAEKLARHAAELTPEGGRTPEGEIAHRKLTKLVEQHPDLADLLEDARASEESFEDLVAPTPAHRHALERMALTTGADVRIYPHANEEPSYRVYGTRTEIRRFVKAWTEHHDGIDLAIQVVGEAWAEMAFPGEAPENDTEEPDLPEGTGDVPTPEASDVEAWASIEAARMERIGARALRIRADRFFAGMRRTLAPLLEEQEGRTVRALLGNHARAWDDPRLTFEEFQNLYRASFPKSRRTDPALRVLYRDGFRIHPGARELRRLRKLAREDWDF